MIFAIIILIFVPFFGMSNVRSTLFRPQFSIIYWFLFFDFLLLGWLGQKVVESPYIELGILSTISYFFIVMVLVLSSGTLETTIIRILQFSLLMGLFYLIVLQLKETVSFAEGKVSYTDEEVFKYNTNFKGTIIFMTI
jgi:hypothetical protein